MRYFLYGCVIAAYCTVSSVYAQTTTFPQRYQIATKDTPLIQAYWRYFRTADSSYICEETQKKNARTVGDAAFDSLIRPAFSNIFLGPNDLVKNSTAASFAQDDKAGTLNLNYAKLFNQNVLNIGAFSKATNGVFGIYTGNSWSADVGMTFGYSKVLHSALYFDTPDCSKLIPQRRAAIIATLQTYFDLTSYDTSVLRRDSLTLKRGLDSLPGSFIQTLSYDSLRRLYVQIDSVLKLYNTVIEKAKDATGRISNDSLKKIVDKAIETWEIKNADIFKGYNLIWLSGTGSISNNALSLADSLAPADKTLYSKKNLAKFFVGISVSGQSNSRWNLLYWSIGANIALHNLLDHPSIKNPYVKANSGVVTIFNGDNNIVAEYEDIKANIFAIEPSGNISWFPGKEKRFGWNLRMDFRLPIDRPTTATKEIYPSTFNLLTGPLFRLNADKPLSAGTVGLDIGFVDCPFETNTWNSFAFKFKVGFPINAWIK